VNGDGFDDLIVGSRSDSLGNGGVSYVVFGSAGGFAANFALSALDGTNGFRLIGIASNDFAGTAVSGAGDVNGDGFDDLLLGAYGADALGLGSSTGAGYVVFGAAGGFSLDFQLADLTGANGFALVGPVFGAAGRALAAAGDINGDGYADVIVGADNATTNSSGTNQGAAYVVFGAAGGFSASLNLTSLNGTNGFRIAGLEPGDDAGISVSGAGDVNGDGYDDLIVGAPNAGVGIGGTDPGAAFVIYGGAGGFAASIDLQDLDGGVGFMIPGVSMLDGTGRAVSGGGDVNGDGFHDLIVGAPSADPAGVGGAGETYVIYGGDFNDEVDFLGTAAGDGLTGTAAAENFVGGLGDDTLDGTGGIDVLRGGAGSDDFVFDAADRVVDGGSGEDTLRFTGGDEALDLTGISNLGYTGIEIVDLTGDGNNTLTLHLGDLFDLSDSTNTLRVDGNAGDVVNSAGQGWVADPGNPETIGLNDYNRYTSGAATLLIDTDITQTNVT
jgi:hypothetical protein